MLLFNIRQINYRIVAGGGSGSSSSSSSSSSSGSNCYYVTDCSKRTAAITSARAALTAAETALNIAQENFDNAKKLTDDLRDEMTGTENQIGNYDSIYSNLEAAGKTFMTDANLSGIRSGYDCLNKYLGELKTTFNKARLHRNECSQKLTEAKQRKADAQSAYNAAVAMPCETKLVCD